MKSPCGTVQRYSGAVQWCGTAVRHSGAGAGAVRRWCRGEGGRQALSLPQDAASHPVPQLVLRCERNVRRAMRGARFYGRTWRHAPSRLHAERASRGREKAPARAAREAGAGEGACRQRQRQARGPAAEQRRTSQAMSNSVGSSSGCPDWGGGGQMLYRLSGEVSQSSRAQVEWRESVQRAAS
jgi:hypothetical protein